MNYDRANKINKLPFILLIMGRKRYTIKLIFALFLSENEFRAAGAIVIKTEMVNLDKK